MANVSFLAWLLFEWKKEVTFHSSACHDLKWLLQLNERRYKNEVV